MTPELASNTETFIPNTAAFAPNDEKLVPKTAAAVTNSEVSVPNTSVSNDYRSRSHFDSDLGPQSQCELTDSESLSLIEGLGWHDCSSCCTMMRLGGKPE